MTDLMQKAVEAARKAAFNTHKGMRSMQPFTNEESVRAWTAGIEAALRVLSAEAVAFIYSTEYGGERAIAFAGDNGPYPTPKYCVITPLFLAPHAPLLARAKAEWHEDDGPVTWWATTACGWASEPPYIGTPNDSDWPGYHTHWTPHPDVPAQPAGGANG